MDMVMHDASGESLRPSNLASRSQSVRSQDSEAGSSQRVSREDGLMPSSEEWEHLIATSVPQPGHYSPAQISLHEQSTLTPHKLIVAQHPQSPASQQQQQRSVIPSQPALPSHTGMYVNLNPDPPVQRQQVLNPQTGQVVGRASSVQPEQVLLQQTGQIVPQGTGQVVTSSEERTIVPVQVTEQRQEGLSPLQARNQEEDANIVSSTLSPDEAGDRVDGKDKVQPTKRELKYKRKYQTSVIDNTKVKLRLLERERQLEIAEQEVDELRKRMKEMENLLKWEKSLGEVAGDSRDTGSAYKRRGI